MPRSMTGFAALRGAQGAYSWAWDVRSVNARGLDVRLRLPDWIEGLEPAVRKAVAAVVSRGNVNVSLRLTRDTGEAGAVLDVTALERALAQVAEITQQAGRRGLSLAPVSAAEIAAMRGVTDAAAPETDTGALLAALTAQLPVLLAAFDTMRASEGAALTEVLSEQLDRVAGLVTDAEAAAEARRTAQAETLRTALARVMENTEGMDEARVAQELALIAVKSDIREELDRLGAHVGAARELLGSDGPRGRKLDFLMQEFNREANTLCSKSQFAELTRIGLDLKHVIDQMREQVQNVE